MSHWYYYILVKIIIEFAKENTFDLVLILVSQKKMNRNTMQPSSHKYRCFAGFAVYQYGVAGDENKNLKMVTTKTTNHNVYVSLQIFIRLYEENLWK